MDKNGKKSKTPNIFKYSLLSHEKSPSKNLKTNTQMSVNLSPLKGSSRKHTSNVDELYLNTRYSRSKHEEKSSMNKSTQLIYKSK